MKRKLAVLMSLVMMTALFTGCGGKDPSDPSNGANTQGSTDDHVQAPADDTVYEIVCSYIGMESECRGVPLVKFQEAVTEASNGRIQFVNYWGGTLGTVPELLDATKNGVMDMTTVITSVYPGEIVATNVLCAPNLGLTMDENGALACWDLLTTNEEVASEWADFKLLGCHTNTEFTMINNKRPIQSLADMKGLRIRTNSTLTTAFMETLGVTPASFNVNDTYENINKNVCDGSLMDWDYFGHNRLFEVCDYALDMNVCSTVSVIIMNQDCYNKLPADLQAVIDEYAGEWLCIEAGKSIAEASQESMQIMIDNGVEITVPNEDILAKFDEATEAGYNAFIEEADQAGFDGASIVEAAKQVTADRCG